MIMSLLPVGFNLALNTGQHPRVSDINIRKQQIDMRKLILLPVFILALISLSMSVSAVNYSYRINISQVSCGYSMTTAVPTWLGADRLMQMIYNASETGYLRGVTFQSNFTVGSASTTVFYACLYEGTAQGGNYGTNFYQDNPTLLGCNSWTSADITKNQTQWQNITLSTLRQWDTTKNYWVKFWQYFYTAPDEWDFCHSNGYGLYQGYGSDSGAYIASTALDVYVNLTSGSGTGSISNVNYTVLPAVGNYSQEMTFYINITGGTAPYNISGVIDGRPMFYSLMSNTNYYVFTTGTYGIGNHTSRIFVTDSAHSNVVSSNIVYWETLPIGMIHPPTLTVTPSRGDGYTTFNFSTGSIYNGTPTYTALIRYFWLGNYYTAGICNNLPENGICQGSFSMNQYGPNYPTGTIVLEGVITDAVGNTAQTDSPSFYIQPIQPHGNPLNVSFSVSPLHNGTEGDSYTLSATINGSVAPYRVIFWDINPKAICDFQNHYETGTYSINVQPRQGDNYFGVTVYGSDSQVYVSNSTYITISYSNNQYKNMLNNIVTGCEDNGGLLGTGNINQTTWLNLPVGSQGTTPTTGANDKALCVGTTCVNYSIIAVVVLAGIGILAEMKIPNAGGKVFALIMFIGIIFLSMYGILPIWIPILIVLVGGLIVWKMFGGGK
jgi:hypothetical protein